MTVKPREVCPVPTSLGTFIAVWSQRGLLKLRFPPSGEVNVIATPKAFGGSTLLSNNPFLSMREFAKRILNPDVQPDCFVGLWPSRNDTLTSHVRVLQEDLEQYFQGIAVPWRTPLDFASATAFQRRVWQAIHTIPFGEVRSYGWLAEAADHPASVRAVANACGANPLPILIACHRVVASDGSLGGFSAGLAWKRKLLQVERNSTRHDYAPLTMEARTPDNYAC